MTSRVTSARLVGRAHELAELELAYADAVAGRPSLASVAGESGVGKSRLLAEAERRLAAGGARVLQGDCVDLGEGELPYAPLVAALRPLARAGGPALETLPPDLREELRAFLPGLPGSAGSSQGRLFEALLALLDALSAQDPLVLSIEDLHWADSSTRAFLSFLARSICGQRLLVMASYRPDELHRRHPLRPLLAALEREPRARRIELQPLTEAELAEQLEGILGAPPADELARRLWMRSEGNPLFTEELLASGLDGRGALPPTLRDALMLRVERLPEAAQDVVRVLAAGQRLPHDVLAEATDHGQRELNDALREAVADHILVADHDGSYRFRHALLGEVVHDDLLPGERAQLHVRLARALEERVGAEEPEAHLAAAIAHHWFAAGDQPAALAAAVRAAGAAERIHARAEAATLLERALELWHRVPGAAELVGAGEAELLLRTARAHDAGPEAGRVVALVERGLALVDEQAEPDLAARLLERLAHAQWSLGDQERALATAQRALDLLPDGAPSVARATVLGWWAKRLMLMGRLHRAVEAAGRAIDEAVAVGDLAAESRSRNALGVSLMGLGHTEAGIAALEWAMELARTADLPQELSSASINLGDALHLAGRSADAVATTRRGLEELDAGQHTWMRFALAEFLTDMGQLAQAEELLPLRVRRPSGTAHLFHELVRAALCLHRGEHEPARAHLEAARPHAETTVEPQFSGPYGVLVADLALREGDLPRARAALETALERIVTCTDDAARVARVAAAAVVLEAAAAQRARDLSEDPAPAIARAEQMAAYVAGAAGQPVEDAREAETVAALARARGADDPELWEHAADAWAAIGRPLAAAADRLRAAEAHVVAGTREPAAALVAEVAALASDRGAGWLASEARSLAARARLRLPGASAPEQDDAVGPETAAEDPFGLTPREQQVLALLAEGATNRRIGEELFMAEKTASVHVSRILAHRLGLVAGAS